MTKIQNGKRFDLEERTYDREKASNSKPWTYWKKPMEAVISFAVKDHRILNPKMRSIYATGQAPNLK